MALEEANEPLIIPSFTFEIASTVDASPQQVWQHAGSMQGVNRELFPLVRMTYPPALAHISPENIPLGKRAFRSWILLFGILPVDYDDLTFVEFSAPGGFLEVSSMLSQKVWQHRRTLRATDEGCLIRDEISFVPRYAILGQVYRAIFMLVFKLRHRNLRHIFVRQHNANLIQTRAAQPGQITEEKHENRSENTRDRR